MVTGLYRLVSQQRSGLHLCPSISSCTDMWMFCRWLPVLSRKLTTKCEYSKRRWQQQLQQLQEIHHQQQLQHQPRLSQMLSIINSRVGPSSFSVVFLVFSSFWQLTKETFLLATFQNWMIMYLSIFVVCSAKLSFKASIPNDFWIKIIILTIIVIGRKFSQSLSLGYCSLYPSFIYLILSSRAIGNKVLKYSSVNPYF